jgi:hypothetical protein
LKGARPLYQVRPIRTGVAAIDRSGLLEITWYTRQLRRIANGKAPDPYESGLKVFAINLYHNLKVMLGGKRQISRLRA